MIKVGKQLGKFKDTNNQIEAPRKLLWGNRRPQKELFAIYTKQVGDEMKESIVVGPCKFVVECLRWYTLEAKTYNQCLAFFHTECTDVLVCLVAPSKKGTKRLLLLATMHVRTRKGRHHKAKLYR